MHINRRHLFALCAVPLLLSVNPVHADEAAVRAALKTAVPDAVPDSLAPAPIPGMFEAVFGTQILYVSADGRYLLDGNLYDLKTRSNLSESKREQGRLKVLASLDPKDMIIFAADKPRHVVTAFTDIDCGYCRKMHSQIADYNKLGITFRYLAYPRAGMNSESYKKAVAVWCADDRQKAMTRAKQGEKLPRRTCDNPVATQMAAAHAVGVTGTPTLVLDTGRVIPGYVEPKRLLELLEQGGQ